MTSLSDPELEIRVMGVVRDLLVFPLDIENLLGASDELLEVARSLSRRAEKQS